MDSIYSNEPVIRLLTAVPLCDGHDSAVMAVNQELIHHGFEVVYLGYHRSAKDIVRAAIQEDVRAIGISSYNGGHVDFFREVVELLSGFEHADIGVFGGGGGTITSEDAEKMKEFGVDEIFFAGTSFSWITQRLCELYSERREDVRTTSQYQTHISDSDLSRVLTNYDYRNTESPRRIATKVIGFTGPGGAGKSTLIDEWIRGYLRDNTNGRVAVLSHDPSSSKRAGLLGDRATMIYSQDDRVFMRSLASRGVLGGLASSSAHCLSWLTSEAAGFDHVLVETLGVGQEAMPFDGIDIDCKVLVLHPEYGARLQLQKILMLDSADVVVINKADWAGCSRAMEEVSDQLSLSAGGETGIYCTQANQHCDLGVMKLREDLLS